MSFSRRCSICKEPSKRTRCSSCNKIYMKEYYLKNKKDLLTKQKIHYGENTEKIKKQRKEYRLDNKEKIALKKKTDHIDNRAKDILRSKVWYAANKERTKESFKLWKEKNKDKYNLYKNNYAKDKYHSDVQFRIAVCLRARLRGALKNKQKLGSAVRDLGCTLEELKIYLESLFYNKMTWDDYGLGTGKWQIDHIINLSSFNLSDRKELLKACHFSNLQPLWFEDHINKTTKERWKNENNHA